MCAWMEVLIKKPNFEKLKLDSMRENKTILRGEDLIPSNTSF